MIGEKKCPYCGIDGKEWKKEPKLFKCPNCNAIFNHFGILIEGEKKEQHMA